MEINTVLNDGKKEYSHKLIHNHLPTQNCEDLNHLTKQKTE